MSTIEITSSRDEKKHRVTNLTRLYKDIIAERTDSTIDTHIISRSFLRILKSIADMDPEHLPGDEEWNVVCSKLNVPINEHLICNMHDSQEQMLAETAVPLAGVSWNELVSLIPLKVHVQVLNQSQESCSICLEIPSVLSAVTTLIQQEKMHELLSPYIDSKKRSVFPTDCLEIIEKRHEQSLTSSQASFRLGGIIIYFFSFIHYC